MRKNKKLLLASVAAMGALALGVGATSTFAWFQATNSISLTNQQTNNVITAANPNKAISSTVALDVTVTRLATTGATAVYAPTDGYNATTNLELASFKSSGTLQHGYLDEAGKEILQDAKLSDLDDWALYEINVKSKAASIDGVSYDKDEVAALLAQKGVQFSVAVDAKKSTWTEVTTENAKAEDGKVYYTKDGDVYTVFPTVANTTPVTGKYLRAQEDSRVRLWKHGTEGTKPTLSNLTSEGATTLSLASGHSIVANTLKGSGYNFYFAFYVEGHSYSDGTASTINADFTVTVS